MAEMPGSTRRHLALYFPYWATDWLKRVEGHLTRPLALYEKQKSAMRLVAVDAEAYRLGLRVGQALADARPLCPQAMIRSIDQGATLAGFEALADWHVYVSPIVCVHGTLAPYGDLVIDITGAAHLWGGEDNLLEAIKTRLSRLGISAQGAIASSVGAAWALAHFAPGTVLTNDAAAALAPLPITALRLDPSVAAGLVQMGLKTIGLLYGRNRRVLAARYGSQLLLRLDQALGEIEERVVPRQPAPDYRVEQRFAEALCQIEPILTIVDELAAALCIELEGAGQGAKAFQVQLFRVDHKVMSLVVEAARPTRDPAHITRLFANRIERLREDFDAGFGIEMIRLGASGLSDLASVQHSVLARGDGGADLVRLYDRLASRLGSQAVLVIRCENSFLPERAARLEPVCAAGTQAAIPAAVDGPRPLRLLPVPEPARVIAMVPDGPPIRMTWRHRSYRFIRTSGPERISAEWWRQEALGQDRDYYRVEDEDGRRFWLFREGPYRQDVNPQWFVHGVFA